MSTPTRSFPFRGRSGLEPPVPADHEFSGVTVILPVVTETDSLEETAAILKDMSDEDIDEVLVVVCDRTKPESLERCKALHATFGDRVKIHNQTLPFLGGAMREAFDLATATHVIMMSTDLETDPKIVPTFIEIAKKNPRAVVTASRWLSGGGFSGYGTLRVGLNWVFQRLTSLLYRTHLTDATFGYRIFPTPLVRTIRWEGVRHEFLLETVLKPLRLGVEVTEVATFWLPRRDGQSQNSVATQARYIGTLVANRIKRRATMLHSAAERADA
ncbi:MAG TPA: glycosyltransferase family 2 protein [Acidimicrobiales bacterium]|nr:glycosyltransferase family 2 protein [Acidimicrobiales bacterium]